MTEKLWELLATFILLLQIWKQISAMEIPPDGEFLLIISVVFFFLHTCIIYYMKMTMTILIMSMLLTLFDNDVYVYVCI